MDRSRQPRSLQEAGHHVNAPLHTSPTLQRFHSTADYTGTIRDQIMETPTRGLCFVPTMSSYRPVHPLLTLRSAAAKPGWIIIGRRVVVLAPQTSRNGVVAIDPHAARKAVAFDT